MSASETVEPPRALSGELLAILTVAIWTAGAVTSVRWGLWLGVGGVALLVGVVLLVLDPFHLRRLLVLRPIPLAVGVSAGAVMCGVTYQVYWLAIRLLPVLIGATGDLYAASRTLPPLQAALALGPVIVGEELAWRGLVQAALTRRLGTVTGVVACAVVYALAHAPAGSPLLTVVALLCGLFWGALRAASGSLVPPLIAHIMWDTSLLLIWPLTGG